MKQAFPEGHRGVIVTADCGRTYRRARISQAQQANQKSQAPKERAMVDEYRRDLGVWVSLALDERRQRRWAATTRLVGERASAAGPAHP